MRRLLRPARELLFDLRLVLRETAGDPRNAVLAAASIALGLFGFLLVDSFRTSMESQLKERSRELLTADAQISSLRALTDDEVRLASADFRAEKVSRFTGFFSMLREDGSGRSRLVEVAAIDEFFPLRGTLRISNRTGEGVREAGRGSGVALHPPGDDEIWVQAEGLSGLPLGTKVDLGDLRFTVAALVTAEPGLGTGPGALAPRIYLSRNVVDRLGLLGKGARVRHVAFFRLAGKDDPREGALRLKERLRAKVGDVKVRTHLDAADDSGRLIAYVSDYLGLAALAALFLAGAGTAYLHRGAFARRSAETAVLLTLGASRARAARLAVFRTALPGLLAGLAAWLAAWACQPILGRVLVGVLPQGFLPHLSAGAILTALATGTLGSLLFGLPVLAQLSALRPSALFREDPSDLSGSSGRLSLLAWVPALLAVWLLAVATAHSWRTGSLFAGLLLASAAVLALLATGLATGLATLLRRANPRNLALRLALRQIARRRLATATAFTAIALGALLTLLVPQLKAGLSAQLDRPAGLSLPVFFLFDIQSEQVDPLRAFARERGFPLENPSPMVRARLSEVNGKPFTNRTKRKATREDEENEAMRDRMWNVTYRADLAPGESIVKGRPFAPRKEADAGVEPMGLSLEETFAKGQDFRLGDLLTFDVSGFPVTAVVTNLRKVNWNTFRPNFFALVEPGFLEAAPQTHLAAWSRIPSERKAELQDALSARFPNVSVLDVSRMVDRFLSLISQLGVAIFAMAALSVATGFLVVFAIARQETASRRRELALLATLGASLPRLRQMVLLESFLVASLATFAGAAACLGVSAGLGAFVLQSPFRVDLPWLLAVLVAVPLVATLVAALGAERTLRSPPAPFLSGKD